MAAVFALVQVAIFSSVPYPAGVQEAGYGLVVALVLGNLALRASTRRVVTLAAARRMSALALLFDLTIAMSFVWLYTFDPTSTLFTVLFITVAEGALRFQLAGALASWGLVVVLYVARELFGRWAYGTPISVDSISFRMGVLLVVAVIMGLMSQRLRRQQQELATALRELQRVDTWRAGLVSVLAHDLRSPLGGVVSCLDMVSRRDIGLSDEKVDELHAIAGRQARRTLRLADDLLDMARLEGGRLVLRPTEVAVRDAVEAAIASIPARDTIDVQVPHTMRAAVDRARFEQIVANLAGNATKHGEPPVVVSAEVGGGELTLRVRDHGAGVPAGDRAGLFGSFAQGPRADSVGLGLWIVAQLATAHGGSASYEDTGEGATFVVRLRELPLDVPEVPPTGAPAPR